MNAKLRAMLLMTAGLSIWRKTVTEIQFSTPEDVEPRKKVIPNGCQEYTFHGITVIAVSEKSARKKIERKLNKR